MDSEGYALTAGAALRAAIAKHLKSPLVGGDVIGWTTMPEPKIALATEARRGEAGVDSGQKERRTGAATRRRPAIRRSVLLGAIGAAANSADETRRKACAPWPSCGSVGVMESMIHLQTKQTVCSL